MIERNIKADNFFLSFQIYSEIPKPCEWRAMRAHLMRQNAHQTPKLMLLRCPTSARLSIQANPNKHQSRFNSTYPQLIVTPKTGLINNQVRETRNLSKIYFEVQVNFLGEGFPSKALVELRADLKRKEDKIHFSSTNRFWL